MQTLEWRFVDMSAWPDGEWQSEPDKIQWQDRVTELPCLAVRHPRGGYWCGYVGVTKDHPAFEKDYDNVDVDVHGGLTFAAHCQADTETGICHIPEAGEPDDVWWFGFDCAHLGDTSPGFVARWGRDSDHGFYKNLAYVQQECAQLAKQLAQMSSRSR